MFHRGIDGSYSPYVEDGYGDAYGASMYSDKLTPSGGMRYGYAPEWSWPITWQQWGMWAAAALIIIIIIVIIVMMVRNRNKKMIGPF